MTENNHAPDRSVSLPHGAEAEVPDDCMDPDGCSDVGLCLCAPIAKAGGQA